MCSAIRSLVGTLALVFTCSYTLAQNGTAQLDPAFRDGLSPLLEYQETRDLFVEVTPAENGLEVVAIYPNSPMLKMDKPSDASVLGIAEIGDVITSINGAEVSNEETLHDLLNQDSNPVTLCIFDPSTGRTVDWIVSPVHTKKPLIYRAYATVSSASPPLSKLHVLLIAMDADPALGRSIMVSKEKILNYLTSQIKVEQLAIHEILSSTGCSPKGILDSIKDLEINPWDSVLVYYLGHGGIDRNHAASDPFGGQFLDLPGNDLLQKALWDQLCSKSPKLFVLITDCCNVQTSFELSGVTEYTASQKSVPDGATNGEWLFFGHSGRCNLNASSRNQFAWYSTDIGGWFTESSLKLFAETDDWKQINRELPTKTNAFFLVMKEQVAATAATSSRRLNDLRNQSQMTPDLMIAVSRDETSPASVHDSENRFPTP